MITDDDPRLGMTEADLQAAVLELAALFGWQTYHTRTSIGSRAGFPDLVLWHEAGKVTLFVELKSTRGVARSDQIRTLESLAAAGNWVAVWRPVDWLNGTIHDRLRKASNGE